MREGGVRLFRDYLGAWMIPQNGIGGEKSKLAQARLQEVHFSPPTAQCAFVVQKFFRRLIRAQTT